MKVFDETPYQSDKGKISLLGSLQGTLKYGFSWYPGLKAQKIVIAQLMKPLERGFTLFRNHMLEKTGIIIPLILIGPPGMYVLYATHLRGMYRARGNAWETMVGELAQPARPNLLTLTARLARVLQVYLQRQGLDVGEVKPVLLAVDPGMQIESARPSVRVVMSDALERFAVSIAQERPILKSEAVRELVERVQHPRSAKPAQATAAASPAPPPPSTPEQAPPSPLPSSGETEPKSPLDFGEISFAFEDDVPQSRTWIGTLPVPGRPASGRRRLSGIQLGILIAIGIIEVCVLIAFILYIFFKPVY
jgi:hypothetical protein